MSFDDITDTNEMSEMIWQINAHLYNERPVSIQEFLDSPKFLGNIYPNIYPLWRELLYELFPSPFTSPFNEVIISASAGCGKTTSATIGMLYNIYKCGCLKSPASYFGLAPNTKLIFAVFSANLALSGDVNWGDLTTAIKEMPWFDGKIVDKKGLDKKNGSLVAVEVLPQIYIQMGSRFGHGMGKALVEVLIDEAAFQQEKSGQAQKTYNETSSRMFTRFASYSKKGELPGHLWLISSPKDATDFLQQQIDEAKKSNSKTTLIKDNIASWEANPANDDDDKFMMFIGNEFKEPHVIEEGEEIEDDDLDYIIYPPTRFLDAFKRNPIANIMNLGGIRTVSTASLFQSQTLLNDAMVIKNPFTRDSIPLPFEGEVQLMDFMDKEYFNNIRHPEANRFIHLDAAFSANTLDRFGIASCYCVFEDQQIYANYEHLKKVEPDIFERAEKRYFIDFAIGIEPLPNQKVPFKKIENLIFYLIKKLQYPVACISADTFQSQRTLQEFETAKLPTANISVDRKKDPYLFLKDCVYDRDIVMVRNEILKTELKGLREDTQKIDHQLNGTKDIADGVCGALWSCKTSPNVVNLASRTRAMLGSRSNIEYNKLTNDEKKALEFMEFEQARASYNQSGMFKNL